MAIASLGDEITIPQPSSVPGGAAQATAQFVPWAQARNLTVSPSGARCPLLSRARLQLVHLRHVFDAVRCCSMLWLRVPVTLSPHASPLLRPARGDRLRHDGADELDGLRVRRIDRDRGLKP